MKKLVLTPEEKQEFDNMPKDQQEKYLEAAAQVRENLMAKLIILTTMTVETLDSLDTFGMNKGKLKTTGKVFKDQLLKFSRNVFDDGVNADISASVDYIANLSEQFDEIIMNPVKQK